MPSKHSRNAGDRHHFTYHEKLKAGHGTIKQRLGSDSQLPFGYCSLSMHPAEQPVVSPSGRIYNREHIIEYILAKTQDLKRQAELYRLQQAKEEEDKALAESMANQRDVNRFLMSQDSVSSTAIKKQALSAAAANSISRSEDNNAPLLLTDGASVGTKRSSITALSSNEADSARALDGVLDDEKHSYKQSRRKLIDDTEDSVKAEQLRRISPWVPQFTPHAEDAKLKEPPKRPPSPFSGLPLRAKDLISIELIEETPASSSNNRSSSSSGAKFLCPVTRKTITNQKVMLIKSTGAYMIEDAYNQLALPTATCPLTGKRFKPVDTIEVKAAASGFAASGSVESKVHRPINILIWTKAQLCSFRKTYYTPSYFIPLHFTGYGTRSSLW